MARAKVATPSPPPSMGGKKRVSENSVPVNSQALRLLAKMVSVLCCGYLFMITLPVYYLPVGVIMVGMAYTWLYLAGLDAGKSAFFSSSVANTLLHQMSQLLRVTEERSLIVKAIYFCVPFAVVIGLATMYTESILSCFVYVCQYWVLPLSVMYINIGVRDPKKSAVETLFPELAGVIDKAHKTIPFYKLDDIVRSVEEKGAQIAAPSGIFNPLRQCTRDVLFWKKRDVAIFGITLLAFAAFFVRGYVELYPEENIGLLSLIVFVPCLFVTSSINKVSEEIVKTLPVDALREEETEEYWKDLPSLQELRAAIPKEFFIRSTWKSLSYVAMDGVQIAALIYLSTWIPSISNVYVRWVLWPLFWYAAGTTMTGWWVLAHECGHSGFSPSRTVNHTVGLILHSVLLVPYHPWRITHGLHHKYNMDMKRDQVFVPTEKSREELRKREQTKRYHVQEENTPFLEAILESPIYGCVVMWVLGWPAYLLVNIAGQDYGRWTSHFHWWSPVFKPEHKWQVIISNLGLMAWFGMLWTVASYTSWYAVLMHYFLPYLWTNFWLVSITYLQHTDEHLPHFRGEAWDFVRGSVCTVDRDYGVLTNYLHHHIGDSHVAHHLFSTMPFYNAKKATPYLKKALGKYYKEKPVDSVFLECFRAWRKCAYVPADGDIVCYRSA